MKTDNNRNARRDNALTPAKPSGSPAQSRTSAGKPSRPSGTSRPAGARPAAPPRRDVPGKASTTETKPAAAAPKPAPAPAAPKGIEIPDKISVRDLAGLMGLSLIDVIKHLMGEGIMANINQQIEYEIAAMVAEDMGFQAKQARPPEPEPKAEEKEKKADVSAKHRVYSEEEQKHLAARPPVVTIMGHVDHGKTKLLDAIRQTNVAAGEAGGITQRIGAYQVEKQGRKITFLDTPGHQAFTAMRARGAKVTDVAVLVVAADDGVMPQTLEAISHARAAQVPIIVAINKIDKEGANPDNVKRQLSEAGLVVEDWGGDIIAVEVSAKAQIGIDALLDMILLVADMAELKALPDVPAKGTVIEASIDKTRGPVATVLVHEGTLKPGDSLVAGGISGKIRAMFNDRGQKIKSAPPATPAVVLGLAEMPEAGTLFEVVADEKTARSMAAEMQTQKAQETSKPIKPLTLDQIFAQIQAGATKELALVLKTDVQGSIEPIVSSLEKLGTEAVKVNLIHTGTGNISENDIMLAAASKAVVIGFAVSVAPAAAKMAESEGVSIRLYDIIYKLIEDVDKALKGMLEPEYKESVIGHGRVLALFRIPRVGTIVGSQITDGRVVRGALVRLTRNGQKIYEGKVASLKRFTEDAKEVTEGFECGIILDNYDKAQPGDTLEFYTKELVAAAS